MLVKWKINRLMKSKTTGKIILNPFPVTLNFHKFNRTSNISLQNLQALRCYFMTMNENSNISYANWILIGHKAVVKKGNRKKSEVKKQTKAEMNWISLISPGGAAGKVVGSSSITRQLITFLTAVPTHLRLSRT